MQLWSWIDISQALSAAHTTLPAFSVRQPQALVAGFCLRFAYPPPSSLGRQRSKLGSWKSQWTPPPGGVWIALASGISLPIDRWETPEIYLTCQNAYFGTFWIFEQNQQKRLLMEGGPAGGFFLVASKMAS